MSSQIILKKSGVASKTPLLTDLQYGELAVNYADGQIFLRKQDLVGGDKVIQIGGNKQEANARLDELAGLSKTANSILVQDADGNLTVAGITSDTLDAVITGAGIDLELKDSGVVAGTYGTSKKVPAITVNAQGQVTGVTLVDISVDFSELTGLPTTLAGYGITDAINVAEKGVAGGVATLDGTGKLPTSQLPALAITDSFVVDSEAEMLELVAQRGDVAIRTDIKANFILAADDASVLVNWLRLEQASDAVSSVNGQTGVVSLTYTDVGAAPAVHDHESISGNAATATKLQNVRTISVSGAATGSGNFDGSANLDLALVLQLNAQGALSFNSATNALTIATASETVDGILTALDYVDLKARVTSTQLTNAIDTALATIDGGTF